MTRSREWHFNGNTTACESSFVNGAQAASDRRLVAKNRVASSR